MALAVRAASSLVRTQAAGRVQRQQPARRTILKSFVVRASAEEEAPAANKGGTYFYAGKSLSEEEWKKAVAEGTVSQPAPSTPETSMRDADEPLSLGAIMAFAGPAPELINGRLAMLAIVAAIGAELSSGESVLRQLADEPTGVILAAITFATASIIPLLSSNKREAWGPFSPNAEMLNGRAAMLGFASLLVIEAVRGGSALF